MEEENIDPRTIFPSKFEKKYSDLSFGGQQQSQPASEGGFTELKEAKDLLEKLTKNLEKAEQSKKIKAVKVKKKKESKAKKEKVLALFSDIMKKYMIDSESDLDN